MRRRFNSKRLVWHVAANTGLYSVTGGTPVELLYGKDGSPSWFGEYIAPLAGHEWRESDLIVDLPSGGGEAVSNAIERECTVKRIRLDVTLRMFGLPGVTSGPGLNPPFICRAGFIVLPSNGDMEVPIVRLDGDTSADLETNWLHIDQFVATGADQPGDVSTWSQSTDGLNHLLINRHYDVKVSRRIGKDDLLLFCFYFNLFGTEVVKDRPDAGTVAGLMHAVGRCLLAV